MDYNTKILIEKSKADAILLEQKNKKIAKANEGRIEKGIEPKPLLVAEVDDRHSEVENVFPFNYEEHVIFNKDGSQDAEQTLSRYRVIFGNGGQIINCAKNSYHIVSTLAVSSLAEAFENEGLPAKPFIFNDGAKIGLSVTFGNRPSQVGECQYTLIVTVPNDGSGMGYLAVKQLRLICGNGQTRRSTVYKDNNIKIPHTFDYNDAIELMKASIQTYGRLLKELEERDIQMAEASLTDTQVQFHLNKWFYQYEMPSSQKTFKNDDGEVVNYTLDMFRAQLVEDADSVPSALRYEELMEALERELEYNKELKLDLSMYTVFATITNYLSRRQEKSGSKAPTEIKSERTSAKLRYFDDILKELV